MKKRIIIFSFTVALLISVKGINAQDGSSSAPAPNVSRVSKGVISSAALSLPVPKYPAAARAVGVRGSVNVAVVIGHDGNIISAEAVRGHPLLRQASVDAALMSKFRPTLLAGVPVEVSGIIVYNYLPPRRPFDPLATAFAIQYVQKTSKEPGDSVFFDLQSTVPQEWTAETGLLQKLAQIFHSYEELRDSKSDTTGSVTLADFIKPDCDESDKTTECIREKTPAPLKTQMFKIGERDEPTSGDPVKPDCVESNEATDCIRGNTVIPHTAKTFVIGTRETDSSGDPVELANSLDEALLQRIQPSSPEAWYYKTGKELGTLLADIDDPAAVSVGIDSIRRLLTSAPSGLPNGISESLNRILELYEDDTLGADDKKDLITSECRKLGI